ncbi:MAG: hypothetical protein LBP38_03650, partial [Desulfovibrio sp.]|nr:hypothetical protein [Desulfovibrio sp.]
MERAISAMLCSLLLTAAAAVYPAPGKAATYNWPDNENQFKEYQEPDGNTKYAPSLTSSGNKVNIAGNVVGSITGGYATQGNVSSNTVHVIRGTISNDVFGGMVKNNSGSATVTSNKVMVSGGQSTQVYGGEAVGTSAATATGNEVIVSGGTAAAVYGGEAVGTSAAAATENRVSAGGGTIEAIAYGGHAETDSGSATATGNEVVVSGASVKVGTVPGSTGIFGGYAESTSGSTEAVANVVTISSGQVKGFVNGGKAQTGSGSATATGNTVTISGGTVDGAGDPRYGVYGGHAVTDSGSGSATATDNTVTISGGTVSNANVYGGYVKSNSGSATATGNSVTVSGGKIDGSVFGGRAENTSGSATATGNSVTVYRGEITGDVYGGYAVKGNASGNTVTISGGEFGGKIYGGYAENDNASGNTVTISGGEFGDKIYGGYSVEGNADGNTVTINGGIFNDPTGGYSENGTANDNTLIINGGTIDEDIYGGYTKYGSEAIRNTVILAGTPDLTKAAISGGYSENNTSAEVFSGNRLIVATDNTATPQSVSNVENYEFVLPANTHDGYVALQSNITFGNGQGAPSKVTNISFKGGGTPLQPGEKVQLFDSPAANYDQLTGLTGLKARIIPGRKGIALLYDFELQDNGTAEVMSLRVNPQTKALSEGRVAGAAFLNQGGDLLAYQGIGAAKAAASATLGLSSFAVTSGGWSRYNTGSHVDVSGVSLLAGMAIGGDTPIGRITGGGFFEGGWGNYDTYNS